MTDNDIIKALEGCVRDISPCATCKYDADTITCDECMGDLMKDALNLINRQKAEIEKKDVEIDILIRKKETLKDEISELKAEVERLEEEVRLAHNVIKRTFLLKAGLKNDPFAEIRAKERKEFAERLKKEALIDSGYEVLQIGTIYNLLAEMESEGQ